MENIKIYNPINVIDNLNNNSGVHQNCITCIECCGSRLFVGTLEGIFFEYFITHDESKYSKVRSTVIGKGQPIVYIRCASALDSVIILCGGTLSLYDLQTLEIKGSNNVSNVTAVSVDENPVGDDPFIVELCFSRRSSIFICHVSSQGFKIVQEINLDSVAISLSVECGLICAALAVGHYIMVNANSPRKLVHKLCDFDSREVHAKVVHVQKEEFLVLGPGSLGVFVSSAGISERPPISWPDRVNHVTVHNSNIVAVCNDYVFIHSLVKPTLYAPVQLSNIRSLQTVEGNLYAWTGSNVYKFKPVSVGEQVQALLATDDRPVLDLSILPDDIPLSSISEALQKAARIVMHKRRRAQLIKALSTRVNRNAKLEESENNQGFEASNDSICDVCNKLLDGIDTISFSSGAVGHDKCFR